MDSPVVVGLGRSTASFEGLGRALKTPFTLESSGRDWELRNSTLDLFLFTRQSSGDLKETTRVWKRIHWDRYSSFAGPTMFEIDEICGGSRPNGQHRVGSLC